MARICPFSGFLRPDSAAHGGAEAEEEAREHRVGQRTEGGGERLLRDGAALDEHFEHGHVWLERRRRRGGGGGAEEERCEHLGQLRRHRPLKRLWRERGVDEANAVAVRALVVGDGRPAARNSSSSPTVKLSERPRARSRDSATGTVSGAMKAE